MADAGAPGQLRDLAVDPDLAEPRDPLADAQRDDPDRDRVLGRGLQTWPQAGAQSSPTSSKADGVVCRGLCTALVDDSDAAGTAPVGGPGVRPVVAAVVVGAALGDLLRRCLRGRRLGGAVFFAAVFFAAAFLAAVFAAAVSSLRSCAAAAAFLARRRGRRLPGGGRSVVFAAAVLRAASVASRGVETVVVSPGSADGAGALSAVDDGGVLDAEQRPRASTRPALRAARRSSSSASSTARRRSSTGTGSSKVAHSGGSSETGRAG